MKEDNTNRVQHKLSEALATQLQVFVRNPDFKVLPDSETGGQELINFKRLARATCVAAGAVLLWQGAAQAQESAPDGLLPYEMSIVDANGNPVLFAPTRVYTEFQYGEAKSDGTLDNVVDYRGNRILAGADFVSPGPWLWGFNLAYTETSDSGRSPFATIETDKEATGISVYVAKPILPNVAIGTTFHYERASGRTVYNSADVNNEDTDVYGFSPFVSITKPLTDKLNLRLRPNLQYVRGSYSYDLNIPPSASTERTSFHVPATLTYDVTPDLSVSGMAGLNLILDQDVFANVPPPSDATLTIGAGASYEIGGGTSIYGSVNHVLFDDNYESTSLRVGLSYAFFR